MQMKLVYILVRKQCHNSDKMASAIVHIKIILLVMTICCINSTTIL